MKQKVPFENNKHRMHFEALLSQGEGMLTAMQEAFIYLIAMGQDDYEYYEGLPFYIEVFEEVSLDGPVYLLEDNMDLSGYRHERLLAYAKCIVRGEHIKIEDVEETLRPWVACASQIAKNTSI
ncbi:MAG: hypothetical protein ACRCW2_06910 [Cellulosilyticaceae bacterium]